MKKFFAVSLAVLLYACKQKEAEMINESVSSNAIDSLISKSQVTSQNLEEINKKSDSAITKKVDGAIKKIEKLETENKVLRNENKQLKDKLNDLDGDGQPYRIRTISDN